jgi:MFS family permease
VGRNFWRLLGASGASNLADGIFFIALPLVAIRFTDSPVLIAGIAVVSRLPWLLFVLVAGALADRLDRRITMRNVQIGRVVIAGGLALMAATGTLSLPVLYVSSFVLGMLETLFDTAAQSMLPSIVAKDDLNRANSRLYAVELTMNQFVGPPLGGIVVAIAAPLALGGSALGYALAAIGLALIVGDFRPQRSGPPTSMLTDIRAGLTYLLGHRLLRTLAFMVGVMNFSSSACFAVFVLFAIAPGPMGLDEAGFGVLMTTMALGSLGGTWLIGRIDRRLGPSAILFLSVIAVAIATAVPGLTPNVWLVGLSFAVAGVSIVMWNVVTVSLRQRIVPDELLGRVNAGYRLLAWGTQPLGAIAGGFIAEFFGLQAVFLVGAVVAGSLVLLRVIVTDEAIAAAEQRGIEERDGGPIAATS